MRSVRNFRASKHGQFESARRVSFYRIICTFGLCTTAGPKWQMVTDMHQWNRRSLAGISSKTLDYGNGVDPPENRCIARCVISLCTVRYQFMHGLFMAKPAVWWLCIVHLFVESHRTYIQALLMKDMFTRWPDHLIVLMHIHLYSLEPCASRHSDPFTIPLIIAFVLTKLYYVQRMTCCYYVALD